MSGLPRPTPDAQVLELTRRLAEDYVSIPLPEVSRVVKDAVTTATGDDEWSGTAAGIPAIVDVIEVLAREDLDATIEGDPPATRASTGRAKKAAPRRGRRQGAE
jgi:hypothetical protein